MGDALRANVNSVLLNRHLTEMVRDVAVPYTPDQLALAPWDRERIHALFDDLEFKVLRDRLFATLSSTEPEAEEGFEVSGRLSRRARSRRGSPNMRPPGSGTGSPSSAPPLPTAVT